MIKTYKHPFFYLCWVLIFLSSCAYPIEAEPGAIDSLENNNFAVTPAQALPVSSASPKIAEVTRIVEDADAIYPTPILPVFPMMDVIPIQPRPEFVRLVGPAEYSVVESDFYHFKEAGVDGIRITGAMRNGFQSAICVNPFFRPLIQQGDDLRDISILWDRMTLLVDGEQKEPYGNAGLGLPVWLSEEDQKTQWVEGDDYCWFVPLQSGIHEVVFQFQQTSGEVQEYKWFFEIID